MDISQLLTTFSGQGRPAEIGSRGLDGTASGRAFAESLAALRSSPTEIPLETPPTAEGQTSLPAMMLALTNDMENVIPEDASWGEGSLTEIAERLALMASTGEALPLEDSELVATATNIASAAVDPDGLLAAVAGNDTPTEASGQLAGPWMEASRSVLDESLGRQPASSVDLKGASLSQQGASAALAAANSDPGQLTQRPGAMALAEAPPQPLARAGDVLMTPMESQPAPGSGEWRSEGLATTLNTASPANTALASATSTQGTLQAPLASPAWPTQLGQQLVMLGQRGGEQRVELHLNPAELGPLTISLKVSEQGAQAQFLSAHAPVRQAVEQAIPQLREALAEQGISLGETSVGEHHQHGQEERQAFAGATTAGPTTGSEDPDGSLAVAAPSGHAIEAGRVDLYA